MVYEDATPTAVRLAGNTTTAKQFLTQTGTGTISAAPAWGTIANTDVSGLGSLSTLNSIDLTANVGSTVLPIVNGGTGSATQNFVDTNSTQTVGGVKTFTGVTNIEFIKSSIGNPYWWLINTNDSSTYGGMLQETYYGLHITSTNSTNIDSGLNRLYIGRYGSFTNPVAIGTSSNITFSSFSNFRNVLDDGTGNMQLAGNFNFKTNGTSSIGSTGAYASNLYAQTVNLNSTASLSGSSAGVIGVTGTLKTLDIQPAGNVTYSLGNGVYFFSGYIKTLNFNSTASFTGSTAGQINTTGLFLPVQAPTASAPSYVKGAMYFDTTANKLMIGGATAWETVTSA
jgi:hypothetical protein